LSTFEDLRLFHPHFISAAFRCLTFVSMIQERLESELRAVRESNARLTRDLKVGSCNKLTQEFSSMVALDFSHADQVQP
jgi:hypothetical protein